MKRRNCRICGKSGHNRRTCAVGIAERGVGKAAYRPTRVARETQGQAHLRADINALLRQVRSGLGGAGQVAAPTPDERAAWGRVEASLALGNAQPPSPPAPRFDLIPTSFAQIVANRFALGASRHGENNWRARLNELGYIRDRANHALLHLLNYIHAIDNGEDGPTDNLAAVAANMAILIEAECLKRT